MLHQLYDYIVCAYRQLAFLRGWPVHVLTDNKRLANINYYRSAVFSDDDFVHVLSVAGSKKERRTFFCY